MAQSSSSIVQIACPFNPIGWVLCPIHLFGLSFSVFTCAPQDVFAFFTQLSVAHSVMFPLFRVSRIAFSSLVYNSFVDLESFRFAHPCLVLSQDSFRAWKTMLVSRQSHHARGVLPFYCQGDSVYVFFWLIGLVLIDVVLFFNPGSASGFFFPARLVLPLHRSAVHPLGR
jgi:hypothetical protein